MSYAVEMIQRFVNGDPKVDEPMLNQAIDAIDDWKKDRDPKKADPVEQLVLDNLLKQLTPEKERASVKTVLLKLPGGAEKLKPPVAQNSSSHPISHPTSKGDDSYQLRALTLDFRYDDESFRGLPQYYTLSVLPKEGFGQNQSSNIYLAGNAEFGDDQWTFFGGGYYDPTVHTLGNPQATFGRAGLQFGLVEYSGKPGKRGPDAEGHFSLFGRTKAGIGLGRVWCSQVEDNKAPCTDTSNQLTLINQTDLFSFGYGPAEFGVRLFTSSAYVQFGGNTPMPGLNRLPIEFFATYHLTPPLLGDKGEKPEDILRKAPTRAENAMTSALVFTDLFRTNYAHKQEAAYQEARMLAISDPFGAQGSKDLYTLTNVGTIAGAAITGFNEGTTAYRLAQTFRYGEGSDQALVAGLLGGGLLFNLIGTATTPGIPDTVQTSPGKAVDPAKVSPENEGITHLQPHAYRLNLAGGITQTGLVALEASGALGDLNQAIRTGDGYYWKAHLGEGLAGLALLMTSGDWSGNGFFGKSIVGNQFPTENTIEIKGSRFDFASQNRQFLQASAGAGLLSSGVLGLYDYFSKRSDYLERICNQDAEKIERHNKEHPDQQLPPPVCKGGSDSSDGASQSGLLQNVRVGFNTDGRTQGTLQLTGVW
jgi:hypothetical protein